MRRLGVFSLGFLWQPRLRKALAAAGWRVVPGPAGVIGVWGRAGVARRGLVAARTLRRPVLTIEDGFLRSVATGPRVAWVSLILDDLGVYYDSTRESRLERLIAEPLSSDEAGASARARWEADALSKYNAAPRLSDPPRDHVLVVDQTAGDASIAGGGAGPGDFDRMLSAAIAENPGARIIVKTHPELASGAKRGHVSADALPKDVELWSEPANPHDLIGGAKAVYTVTSQMGFEAVLKGRPVRVFGAPFYAGWGLTEDEAATPARREARPSADRLAAAALLDYPTYVDPWRGDLTGFHEAVDAIVTLRGSHERTRAPSDIFGARLWKRPTLAAFLDGEGGRSRFVSTPAAGPGRRLVAWASAAPADTPCWRIEDGFLRSSGLGAALTPALSLALDDLGIYYDATRPSRLERLIEAAATDPQALARAAALRERITALGITKYNLDGAPAPRPPAGRRVILAPGQVDDDASIRLGAGEARRAEDLLAVIRREAPDAYVIFRPHPDVVAGLRPGLRAAGKLADVDAPDARLTDLLAIADEVWTITSLTGFEALIRGTPVTCLGAPFYAGWGLTRDLGPIPERRRARPSLDQLVHAALIDYPLYRDPVSGFPCGPELAVERLAAGDGGRPPVLRALSKAQAALKGYAWLWR